jgi:hypothetical protein
MLAGAHNPRRSAAQPPAEEAWNIDVRGCRRVSAYSYGPAGMYLRPLTDAEQADANACELVVKARAALAAEDSGPAAVVRMRRQR